MLGALPPELIALVVRHCIHELDDRAGLADLARLALVSHAFLDPVRREIYRRINLEFRPNPVRQLFTSGSTDWGDLGYYAGDGTIAQIEREASVVIPTRRNELLQRTLSANKHLRLLVRAVTFAPCPGRLLPAEEANDAEATFLASILALCTNITQVENYASTNTSSSSFARILHNSDRQFTSLDLPWSEGLITLLGYQPSLQRLGISPIPSHNSRDNVLELPTLPNLSLTLDTLSISTLTGGPSHTSRLLGSLCHNSLHSLTSIYLSSQGFHLDHSHLAPFINLSHVALASTDAPSDLLSRVNNTISSLSNLTSLALYSDQTPNDSLKDLQHLGQIPTLQSLLIPFSITNHQHLCTLLKDLKLFPVLKTYDWLIAGNEGMSEEEWTAVYDEGDVLMSARGVDIIGPPWDIPGWEV